MDRNQIIGIVLITILFSIYIYFSSTQQQPATNIPTDTIASNRTNLYQAKNDSLSANQPTTNLPPDTTKYASFASYMKGTEKIILLENKELRIELTNKGGKIKSVQLKNYLTYDKKPLYLNTTDNTNFSVSLPLKNTSLDVSSLYFDITENKDTDTNYVLFKIETPAGNTLLQKYALSKEGFQVNHFFQISGFENEINNTSSAQIHWIANLPRLEYDAEDNRNKSTVNYYTTNEGFGYLSETSTDEETESLASPVKWLSFKNKFFNSAFISESASFKTAILKSRINKADTLNIKQLEATLILPVSELRGNKGNFKWYFGPNKYGICKNVTEGFEENVYLGWPVIKWINRFVVIPVFNFLEGSIANYGIIIIILVLLLKVLLLPLSFSSYKAMAKMKVMKPDWTNCEANMEMICKGFNKNR